MTHAKSILVTDREKKILDGLRELPAGDLKRTTEAFLLELSDRLSNPRCAQVQADGIPCGESSADCEDCLSLKQLVSSMRNMLQQEVAP